MTRVLGTVALAAALLAGEATAQAVDLSTPERTMQTFLTAIRNRDAPALAACFSDSAEGEFADVRAGRLSDEDWHEWQAMFRDAAVTGLRPGATDALVHVAVKLRDREETLHLAREPEGWRILGF